MKLIRKIHKWLSLVVGLQLLIWLGTGFYFNMADTEKSSGNQYRVRPQLQTKVDLNKFIEPQKIIALFQEQNRPVISLKQIQLLAQPYYLLTHEQGLYPHFSNSYSLVHAYDGDEVFVDELMAKTLAHDSYNGAGQVKSVIKLSPPYEDIPSEKNAVWQVSFDDEVNTHVYIEIGSGRLVTHSNDDKHFADFFFMLHFMDYAKNGGFNNIQMIIFAIFTLFLSLTGFIWTFELIIKGRYRLTLFSSGNLKTK